MLFIPIVNDNEKNEGEKNIQVDRGDHRKEDYLIIICFQGVFRIKEACMDWRSDVGEFSGGVCSSVGGEGEFVDVVSFGA